MRQTYRCAVWVGCVLLSAVSALAAVGQEPTARVDQHGDPLPPGALARLGTVRFRHGHNIKDVAYSPDGKMLASADWGHTVRLWDPETGKELRALVVPGEEMKPYSVGRWQYCLAFSPDGQFLAVGEHAANWPSQAIRIWWVKTGKLLHTLAGHPGGVLAVAFAPKGTTLVSAEADGIIRVWDPNMVRAVRMIAAHTGAVRSVAFAADGTLISAGDDAIIRTWDIATGARLREISGHTDVIESVGVSADGATIVSAGRDVGVRLWDAATGKNLARLEGHNGTVLRVRFSPDGRTLASSGADRTICLWDVATHKQRHVLKGHNMEARGLAFSKDGRTLASGGDDSALVWDLTTRAKDPATLGELWDDLAKPNGAIAYRAQWELVARSGQAVALFGNHLRPAAGPAEPHIAKMVRDLDSDDFDTRQRAMQELAELGDVAEPSMRQALLAGASLEQRRRIEALLMKLTEAAVAPPRLRVLRAVETLERIATPEAQALLQTLAKGAAGARQTREARQALERLGR